MSKNYHPQLHVFRIINGEMVRVKPYRFTPYNEELHYANEKAQQEPQGPYIKSILFDGVDLVTTAVDKNGETVEQFLPAYSGTPRFGTEFDYSKYRQERAEGPIPEGDYSINPQEVQRPTLKDEVAALAGDILDEDIGRYPGGRYSWGNCRISISQSEEQKKETGRDHFFIHGGEENGSAGCIDLVDRDSDFCEFIEKYRCIEQSHVPLKVKYLDAVKDVPDDEFEEDKEII